MVIAQTMIDDMCITEAAGEISARLRVEANLPPEERGKRANQGPDRWLLDVHTGSPFVDCFDGAGQARGQRGYATGGSLQIDATEALVTVAHQARSKDHEVRVREDIKKLLAAHETREPDSLPQV